MCRGGRPGGDRDISEASGSSSEVQVCVCRVREGGIGLVMMRRRVCICAYTRVDTIALCVAGQSVYANTNGCLANYLRASTSAYIDAHVHVDAHLRSGGGSGVGPSQWL